MKTFNQFLEVKGIKEDEFEAYDFSKKTELSREYNSELKSYIVDLEKTIKEKAGSNEIEELKAEFEEAKEKRDEQIDLQMKSINDSLKQHGLVLKKVLQGEKQESKGDSLIDQAKACIEENKDKIDGLINGSNSEAKKSEFSFDVKGLTLKEISIGGSISGGNVPVEQRIAGVNNLPTRQIRLLDVIATGSAISNVISWVYEATETGSVGGTAEGVLKNEIDLAWVVDSENVKKRTGFFKATTESLEDIDWMATQLNNNLMKRLMKDIEEQVHAGDALGQNLNGLKTIASPFSAAPFAGTVDNANEVDVLIVAIDNIIGRDQPMPNFITMNHSDVTTLKLIKASTTDRRYVDRLTMVAGQLSLDGIPIIATTLETQDEYLIGNGTLATLYDKGQIRIDVGLDGNDFTENKRTILGEWRGALVVETNDRSAFVTGVFSTDKAALETP
jgi:hypothetical protein